MSNIKPPASIPLKAAYQLLFSIDQQTFHLCRELMNCRLEPSLRVKLAEELLMIQQDRLAIVNEITSLNPKNRR